MLLGKLRRFSFKTCTILAGAYLLLTLIVSSANNYYAIENPVQDKKAFWDQKSFWHYGWGDSEVHKGIDIFAKYKSLVISPVNGVVIESDYGILGGNYVYILGQDLKVYYFAHLDTALVEKWTFVNNNKLLGTVGNTGNAMLKPPHLHFSIYSIVPILQNCAPGQKLGLKRMFYLDPGRHIK